MDVNNKSPTLTKAHEGKNNEPNRKEKKKKKYGLLEKIERGLRVPGLTVIIRTESKIIIIIKK